MPDEGDTPKTRTVDLGGGVSVTVPEDQAAALIAFRDEAKTAKRKVDEIAAQAEAERARAEEEAARKAGDLDRLAEQRAAPLRKQIEQLQTQMAETEKARVAEQQRSLEYEARSILGSRPTLAEGAQELAWAAFSRAYSLDRDENGAIRALAPDGSPVLGSDGKPLALDGVADAWISSQQLLRRADVAPGTGASPNQSLGTASGKRKITRAEYDADPAGMSRAMLAGDVELSS